MNIANNKTVTLLYLFIEDCIFLLYVDINKKITPCQNIYCGLYIYIYIYIFIYIGLISNKITVQL